MMLELTRRNILNLTNESKRKNILAAWRSWGIWHKGGKLKAGSKAESLLTDKLKELRKELLSHEN